MTEKNILQAVLWWFCLSGRKPLSIAAVHWYVCLSVSLSVYCIPLLPFPQFVLDLLTPPGDLWFMGTPVSHNKAVSNEAREGDLCVYICVCFCVCARFFCLHMHALLQRWQRACELNGKQSIMSFKMLDTKPREKRGKTSRKERTVHGHKTANVWGDKKEVCCRKRELFEKGTHFHSPTLHHKQM